ncbi:MAG: carboxypeptidase regulatory-like domain-containing protein [Candidatus Hydrogenedentes bacterium]|nr:carboxypeptidase regulatory-like domain-containing protein [Candidatus Hydrogenedentota bacterium]
MHADRLHTIVETDSTGRWMRIPNRPIPLDLAIVVEHPKYAPSVFNISPQRHTELSNHTAELKIERGCEVSGVTVDQLGKPVHRATLRVLLPISATREVLYWPILVPSRTDGTFDLRIPSKTTCNAHLLARGYREQSIELTAQALPLTLTLTPYEKLRGRIVDESELPVKNAEIELHPSDDEFWNSVEMSVSPDGWCAQSAGGETWSRKSDPDGIFGWLELENTRYDLTVKCEGYRDLVLALPTSDEIQTIILYRLPAE